MQPILHLQIHQILSHTHTHANAQGDPSSLLSSPSSYLRTSHLPPFFILSPIWANCRHGCFGLLALISAVQPRKAPTRILAHTYTHTHTHTHTTQPSNYYLQMDVSGCWPSSVQCSRGKPDYSIPCYSNTYWTIQPHTTALANNTQTIIYNIYRHMHIKITAILHTKLTIPLHSHNTFTHTHITHMHTTHTHTHTHTHRRCM